MTQHITTHRVTVRQAQKRWYHYLRMVRKGVHIQVSASKRRPDPIAVLVPYGWYVEARGVDAWQLPDGRFGLVFSREVQDLVLQPLLDAGRTPEEAIHHLLNVGLAELQRDAPSV